MDTFKLYKMQDKRTKEERMLLLTTQPIWERHEYYGWYISDECDLNTIVDVQRGEIQPTMCMWSEPTMQGAIEGHKIIDTVYEGNLRDCIQYLRMLHVLGELNVK